eukprot:5102007-Prymnesium_polylepis.1
MGENENALLKKTIGCGMHAKMRLVEWVGNRCLAPPKAKFKRGSHKKQIKSQWNDRMRSELGQKNG